MRRHPFVVILIVGILLAGAFLAYYLHQEVKEQVVSQFTESQLQIARQTAGQIESYLDARSQDARQAALLTSLQPFDLEAMSPDLQARFARLKTRHVDEVAVVDPNGKVVYSTAAGAVGSDYRRFGVDAWGREPVNRNRVRLAMERLDGSRMPPGPRPTHRPLLTLATPLYQPSLAVRAGAETTFAGVLLLTVDLQGLAERALSATPFGKGSAALSTWMIDADGTVLLQSEHPEMVSRNIRTRDASCQQCHVSFDYAERMLTVKEGAADYQLKGRHSKIAAFTPLSVNNASWIVVVNAPKDQVTGFVQTNFLETLGLFGMVGVVLGVAFFFVNRSSRQETIIAEEARHLAEKEELVEELRQDIAERKRAEEGLRVADEQLREQAALVRLGEMAAVVAHEVKNPLAGIRGTIQVIASRLPQGMKEVAIIGDVIARIDALDELMKDLLLFARPPQMHPGPVDLVALAKETTELVSQDPAARDVRFEVDGSAPLVVGDAKLLKIVFLNLMVNATHALRNNGTIRASVTATDRTCQIAIADSGPGIPPEIRDRIFIPFFTTKTRGTGLGLSTAKRLVDAHHGRIIVDCPEGGGTVVAVELPREPDGQAAAHA